MCWFKNNKFINIIKSIFVYDKKNSRQIYIGDKIIYNVKTQNGWSIVIMPDNILIDNYYSNIAHIHPNPENHTYKINLKCQSNEEIYEIIKDYLNVSEIFDVKELVEILK